MPLLFFLTGHQHHGGRSGAQVGLQHRSPLPEKPSTPVSAHFGTHPNRSVFSDQNHHHSVFMQSVFVLSKTVLTSGLTTRPQLEFLITLKTPPPLPCAVHRPPWGCLYCCLLVFFLALAAYAVLFLPFFSIGNFFCVNCLFNELTLTHVD